MKRKMSTWYSHQRIIKRTERTGNKRTGGNYPNYYTIMIGQNTGKSQGKLEETCCHSKSSEKSSANADVKSSQGVNNTNEKKKK